MVKIMPLPVAVHAARPRRRVVPPSPAAAAAAPLPRRRRRHPHVGSRVVHGRRPRGPRGLGGHRGRPRRRRRGLGAVVVQHLRDKKKGFGNGRTSAMAELPHLI